MRVAESQNALLASVAVIVLFQANVVLCLYIFDGLGYELLIGLYGWPEMNAKLVKI